MDQLESAPEISLISRLRVPMAFIQLREGEIASANEIIDFCKDRLSNIKVPRYVRFVTEFPTTMQGKIQKFKLREAAIQELGLQ